MTRPGEKGDEINVSLTESTFEKDLGVYIDNKLSFNNHVSQTTSKANKIVGLIRLS